MSFNPEDVLDAWAAGTADPERQKHALGLVYTELVKIARAELSRHRRGSTLDTRALVNEAYLKLRRAEYPGLEGRAHFFSLVARAMRQILIDHARSRLAEQRRMREVKHDLDARPFEDATELARLLEVDSALNELEREQPRLAQVVLYRYFAGYTPQETADLLDVHVRTVTRDWHKARAWLMLALERQAPANDDA